MKKRVVVLATAMTAAMIFGTTAMAEEGGLSGKFSLFHFRREGWRRNLQSILERSRKVPGGESGR